MAIKEYFCPFLRTRVYASYTTSYTLVIQLGLPLPTSGCEISGDLGVESGEGHRQDVMQ